MMAKLIGRSRVCNPHHIQINILSETMTAEILAEYQYQYVDGQRHPSHAELLESFNIRSSNALVNQEFDLDIPYGTHARQKLDVFYACGECKGSVLYFHAGYWQSRDKASFRFLAEPLTTKGLNVILANYPLCPDVPLDSVLTAAAEAFPFVANRLGERHPSSKGYILAGHSAGAHIAVELALKDWSPSIRLERPIESIIAVSGIFDLTPLVFTSLNSNLRLSIDDAKHCSPALRIKSIRIPASFIVGGIETSEFKRQSVNMSEIWKDRGGKSSYIEVEDKDHFSVLETLENWNFLV